MLTATPQPRGVEQGKKARIGIGGCHDTVYITSIMHPHKRSGVTQSAENLRTASNLRKLIEFLPIRDCYAENIVLIFRALERLAEDSSQITISIDWNAG